MASIIISGNIPTELNDMVNNLLKGKISISQFIKFLDNDNLKTKVRCIKRDINSSVLDDLVGDTLSTIFSIPKKSEFEDTEDNDDEETEDDGCKNPDKFCGKTKEEYEEDVNDTVEYAKRLIDDYGDFEEDDIDHTKAVRLFLSMMNLGRTFRKRAIKGYRECNIPTFTPESILKFIESIDLPIDKIEAALERGKSNYYKNKIYKSFDDFVTSMKDIYGIEDVWNPPKEIPEWFESVRNIQYRKFYPSEDIFVDESEWNEFKKWKEENKNKEYIDTKANKLFRDILNIKPDLDIYEMIGINELAMRGCVKGLEECLDCLKKSKNSSIINTILKNSCYSGDNTHIVKKNDNKESSDKKSSTSKKATSSSKKDDTSSKKTTSSASAKKEKTTVKKTTVKSKTDAKIKEFKKYADYILSNSIVEDAARDLLLSYAANLDERCKKLYEYLVDLKKRKKSVKLIKYYDEKAGNTDIAFAEL